MRFARGVFLTAGVYGLLVTLPQLFLEERTSRDFPPAITHPEFFCGFVGTVLAWQVLFLLIGRDPVRYRPLMLVSLIEKGVFGIAVPILYRQGRVASPLLSFAAIDVAFAFLFFQAWRLSRSEPSPAAKDDPSTEVLILDLRRALEDTTRAEARH
jgi:hypothetical protein